MQKISIKIKAYDSKIIDSASKQIIDAAGRTGATILGPVFLPTKKSRWTVQASPFVHGKHMDHYEMRTHKRLIVIQGTKSKNY